MASGLQLHTRNLTAAQTFTLDGSEGVLFLSYQMSGTSGDNASLTGTISFKASSDSNFVASAAVTVPANGVNTFVSDSNQKAIALTLTCNQGTLRIIIGF